MIDDDRHHRLRQKLAFSRKHRRAARSPARASPSSRADPGRRDKVGFRERAAARRLDRAVEIDAEARARRADGTSPACPVGVVAGGSTTATPRPVARRVRPTHRASPRCWRRRNSAAPRRSGAMPRGGCPGAFERADAGRRPRDRCGRAPAGIGPGWTDDMDVTVAAHIGEPTSPGSAPCDQGHALKSNELYCGSIPALLTTAATLSISRLSAFSKPPALPGVVSMPAAAGLLPRFRQLDRGHCLRGNLVEGTADGEYQACRTCRRCWSDRTPE